MSQLTRRNFTRAAAATMLSIGPATTALSRARVVGANDRVRVGLIGCGGRGKQLWKIFLARPDVQPVVVSDVYAPFAREAVRMAGGTQLPIDADFRRVLDRKDVDAVIVATPDHWHHTQTVMACQAGKDVYCEKPLTLTVKEGRRMVRAAREHKRVVQTGSQQRSGAHYARAIELIRGGALGAIHRVAAGFARNVVPGFTAHKTDKNELDWAMWLGPAPNVPYDPFRCIYHFRWFWDYSGGQMTNWGAHHLDIVRWALGAEAPTSVSGAGGRFALKDGGETPDVQQVTYTFPGTVVTWTVSEISGGGVKPIEFFGSKGSMTLARNGFQISPEVVDKKPLTEPVQEKGADLEGAHVNNFLECVRSRRQPVADIEEGHRTAAMCHLGNIATRLGRTLKWDAGREQVVGDKEADKLLDKEYSKPWKS